MKDLLCLMWYGDEIGDSPEVVPVADATHTWAGRVTDGEINPYLLSCLVPHDKVPVAVSLAVSRYRKGEACARSPANLIKVQHLEHAGLLF